MRRHLQSGWSLAELMIVVAVLCIAAGIASFSFGTFMMNVRADSAMSAAVARLRLAREHAIDERRVWMVRFSAPNTITTYRLENGALNQKEAITTLPADMQFRAEPGIPTASTKTPDQLSTTGAAIDFNIDNGGGQTDVYFYPDGSAKDSIQRANSGVVYMARPGALQTSRAVSLFGPTGRIKPWRPDLSSGAFAWR